MNTETQNTPEPEMVSISGVEMDKILTRLEELKDENDALRADLAKTICTKSKGAWFVPKAGA